MSDQLTQKFKQELEKRGKVATDVEIQQAIFRYQQRTQPVQQSPIEYEPEEEDNNLGLLNAAGVGVYTALDTGLFGVPALF